MPRWRILDGPNGPHARSLDADIFHAVLVNQNDPGQRRAVQVEISRTALACDPETLPREVLDAIESRGRAAIDSFLDELDPPARIAVSTAGVRAVVDE